MSLGKTLRGSACDR